MKLAGLIYGLTNGPRGWSAFLHFYYKKIVAQTMALVCTTNVSMLRILKNGDRICIIIMFCNNFI